MAQPLPKIYRRFPKELFRINSGALVKVRPKLTPDPVPIASKYDIVTTGLEANVDAAATTSRVDEQHGSRAGGDRASPPAFTSMWMDAIRPHSGGRGGSGSKESHSGRPAWRIRPREFQDEHVEPRSAKGMRFTGPNGLRLRLNTPFTQHYILRQWEGPDPVVFAVQAGTPLPNDLVLVRLHPENEEWSLEPARRMTLQELNDAINKFLSKNAAKLTRQQWSTAYPRATEPLKPVPVPSKWKVPSRNWLAGRVRRGPLFYPQKK